ncbi:hypothetical protein [Scytonema sp. NUACC26]|uniref:hypothetical protein n=1 Tax=Scytonema sp. NUACC26 TaxID=3140176 RepID=UPI0034DBF967
MLQYNFFPESFEKTYQVEKILQCFVQVQEQIDSQNSKLSSNEVLSVLRPYLKEVGMQVEEGKAKEQRIRVPILFGVIPI